MHKKIEIKDLPKGWEKKLIKLGEGGASMTKFADYIGMQKATMLNKMKDWPELDYAIKGALQKSEMWWEDQGQENLKNKEFNATLYMMNMSNRFNWRRKDDLTTNDKPIESHTFKFTEGELKLG